MMKVTRGNLQFAVSHLQDEYGCCTATVKLDGYDTLFRGTSRDPVRALTFALEEFSKYMLNLKDVNDEIAELQAKVRGAVADFNKHTHP